MLVLVDGWLCWLLLVGLKSLRFGGEPIASEEERRKKAWLPLNPQSTDDGGGVAADRLWLRTAEADRTG